MCEGDGIIDRPLSSSDGQSTSIFRRRAPSRDTGRFFPTLTHHDGRACDLTKHFTSKEMRTCEFVRLLDRYGAARLLHGVIGAGDALYSLSMVSIVFGDDGCPQRL